MDEQIGRLRAELRRLGIDRRTVVFFTSDNGPSDKLAKQGIASAGPFRGHKHTMYEGGLRVPAVVEWPGVVAPGTTSDAMAATVDYFPTIAELVGQPSSLKDGVACDGVSMLGLLQGKHAQRPAPLFFGYRRLVRDIDGQALV